MSIQKKKYYLSPKIESVKLDRGISLGLITHPPEDPIAAPVGRDRPSFGPSSASPSSVSNPFGSSRPDYGDM